MAFLRWIDRLNHLFTVLLGLAFAVMTLSIFLQVLVRFVFTQFSLQISVPWTEEIARYLMIWSVFLGGAVAARKDRLIALEALVHSLPERLGQALKVGALLITIVFFTYLIVIGYDLAANQGLKQTSPVLGIPMAAVYLAMPVGAIATILNILSLIIESRYTNKDIRFISVEEEKEEIEEEIEEQRSQRGGNPE